MGHREDGEQNLTIDQREIEIKKFSKVLEDVNVVPQEVNGEVKAGFRLREVRPEAYAFIRGFG